MPYLSSKYAKIALWLGSASDPAGELAALSRPRLYSLAGFKKAALQHRMGRVILIIKTEWHKEEEKGGRSRMQAGDG